MINRTLADRDVEDMETPEDFSLAKRILASLHHPDCPVAMFDFEMSKLARHIAIRVNRNRPPRVKNLVGSKYESI